MAQESIIDDIIGTGADPDSYRPAIADDLNNAGNRFWDWSAAMPPPLPDGSPDGVTCMVTIRRSASTTPAENPPGNSNGSQNVLLARVFDDTTVEDLPPNAFGQMNATLARNGFPPKDGGAQQRGRGVIRETGKAYNANTNADRTAV